MSFNTAILASRFEELEETAAKPKRFVIAFSGGLDSSALLHCVAGLRSQTDAPASAFADVPLLAVHVDHGLHPDAADWSRRCAEVSRQYNIEFRTLEVTVATAAGKGLEAAARDARYAALQAQLVDGDWLLTAHHREDQAETLLLNLIRGSGPAGIAAIGDARRFGPGWLLRPLLAIGKRAILEFAHSESLTWLEDPSNEVHRFDRNYLRHAVFPNLRSRWPDIAVRFHRSAGHVGEAAVLLDELGQIDLLALGGQPRRLPFDRLGAFSAARQRNVIRYALRQAGLTIPTTRQLDTVIAEVLNARIDAQPLVTWPGTAVRRYRNALYLLPDKLPDHVVTGPLRGAEMALGEGLGCLQLSHNADAGLDESLVKAGLIIRSRAGGEEIKPKGQIHTRKLKNLLQEEGVVPWMRDRLPLLYADGKLVAVADLWIADEAVSRPGVALRWIDRPALH